MLLLNDAHFPRDPPDYYELLVQRGIARTLENVYFRLVESWQHGNLKIASERSEGKK